MELNDAAVVAQVLTGDREAFRVLVERHSRNVFKAVYRMTNNQEDADEIVQETFLRAYKSLERFQERSSFYTWVYRIAMNRTLDFLSVKKPKQTVQISDNPDPEEGEIQLASDSPGPERALLRVGMKALRMAADGQEGNRRVRAGVATGLPARRMTAEERHCGLE